MLREFYELAQWDSLVQWIELGLTRSFISYAKHLGRSNRPVSAWNRTFVPTQFIGVEVNVRADVGFRVFTPT